MGGQHMADYRVISSDSHVIEPADLWATRIEHKFRDRAPEIVTLEEGDWWFCDGRKVIGLGIGTQAGVRFEHPEDLRQGASFEDVRPGGYIPAEHVKDMDADGVDAGVVYPSISFMMYNVVPESDLLSAIFHAYNGWVGEFCKSHPDRLKPIAMLNLDDLDLAIKDLQHYANLGFVGAARFTPTGIRAPVGCGAGPAHQLPRLYQPPRHRPGVYAPRLDHRLIFMQPGLLGQNVTGPHDIQRRLRAVSQITSRGDRVRAGMGPSFPGPDGLHLHPEGPQADLAPVQRGHASK